ncbi:GntR family transcriptional regulator [Streptomyces sp. Ru73]|uniref:GntR family transcriptional regulator n=1 Tax=Streptomyces sp. Ru73 TaxID=2080748 RepID=UPI000CDE47D2|nr:winged helix-turn-helix domain-containing protein [Streptomyces sp. Ru73]POX41343.1 GntR family transcriptional regulator [Streptomyces sp. Ru73]
MAEFTGQLPAYMQIANRIKAEIRAGERAPGDKLPSEAELMREHSVSRTVARQAISRLREDGFAVSHQGKGSFVANLEEGAQRRPSSEYEQITEHLDQVLRDVRDLARRMDALEEVVRRQTAGS